MVSWFHPQCLGKAVAKNGGVDAFVEIVKTQANKKFPEKPTEGQLKEALLNTATEQCSAYTTNDSPGGKRPIDQLVKETSPKPKKSKKINDDDYDLEEENMSNEELERRAKELGFTLEYYHAYVRYKAMKIDELKDYLRWNDQLLKGVKNDLVDRCADGEAYGALARCQQCSGKLELINNGKLVKCNGTYDETAGGRINCFFKCAVDKAPRNPWRTTKPTEEEELEKLAPGKVASNIPADLITHLDLTDKEQRSEALSLLLGTCRGIGINLSEDDLEAKRKIGGQLLANKAMAVDNASNFIDLLAKNYGQEKPDASGNGGDNGGSASKKASGTAACPENAALVGKFLELSNLYRKDANPNAANTYNKAANALSQFQDVITSGNQFRPKKGGQKVEGLGDKSCSLIDEFLTKGELDKVIEKKQKLGL